MLRAALLTMVMTVLGAGLAAAQALPVRIHKDIRTFAGSPEQVIAVTSNPQGRISLVSAHKEAGRPWADAILRRDSAAGTSYMSRGYNCERGTYRWLGDADDPAQISVSVTAVAQVADRPLIPGTLEYQLARYVCAL